jgi:ABC-type multidrug transport system fused ATPase/permease subunit
VRPHRRALLAGAALSLVTGATGLLLPLVARELIDDLGHDRSIAGALPALTALVVANSAVGAVGSYVLRRTAESVVLGARRAPSSYLPRLRITAVDRSEPGDLMARITSATTLLREVTTDSLADVRFRYADDLPPVHHGVTFAVPARGMTAFVGPSGAGKTTVFSLIERFYEPESGTIALDGRDLAEWELSHLRSCIGYVEQDAPVLSGSLRDNLVLGNAETDDDTVRAVLKTTRLDELVARLPQGLETLVGHRGTRLSGGERLGVPPGR